MFKSTHENESENNHLVVGHIGLWDHRTFIMRPLPPVWVLTFKVTTPVPAFLLCVPSTSTILARHVRVCNQCAGISIGRGIQNLSTLCLLCQNSSVLHQNLPFNIFEGHE